MPLGNRTGALAEPGQGCAVKQGDLKPWCGVQVELVVDEMRRSLARRAGVDRRLPQFVGLSGFQDFAINIVVLVTSCLSSHPPQASVTHLLITMHASCICFVQDQPSPVLRSSSDLQYLKAQMFA